MKKLSLVLMALFVLNACEKVDPPLRLTYPSLYRSVRLENTTNVRLFTVNGEISDASVVTRFAERFGENFLYPNSLSVQPGQADSIRLLSATDAQIKEGDRFRNFILLINGNGRSLSFVPLDTARITGVDENVFNLQIAIGKRKPLYQNRRTVPGTTGFTRVYDLVMEKFATVSPEQMDFPVLNYVLARGAGLNQSIQKVSFNNQFDPSANQILLTGDTLAVQEFVLKFEK